MRFHVAWDSIERENRTLKFIITMLLTSSVLLSIAVMAEISKAPLVIERECYSKQVLPELSAAPTELEMQAFVEEAVKFRFNTADSKPAMLTKKQTAFKDQEQAELLKQQMKQVVVVNHVEPSKDGVFAVDTDRLISVGDVRSTFKFPLNVKIERTSRSKDNSYGLLLSEVNPVPIEVTK